ncbi:hypothetical protein E0485_13065 [Paenibacillus albiflavus]|uniref:HEAT repeat domain-containing protein n=1 Tax=Paenibacillus albiflavus TaxID=2545760 RepID=A0A4R4EEM9_9BACL|nr:hypothetical protein [Paenibacillus albiflavus]TCZ76528.1 hypothetical protein E0485_13065 [Paenibacillus albiflavus]
MNWYTMESIAVHDQAEVTRHAKEQWKFMPIFKTKRSQVSGKDSTKLAVQALQEMLESDNAELRLRAADIILKHSSKNNVNAIA